MDRKNQVNIFLFAAGLGTRLKPYTDKWPKPAIPLLGTPLGYYVLPYLLKTNFNKIVVNTFHLPDKIHKIYQYLENIDLEEEQLTTDLNLEGSRLESHVAEGKLQELKESSVSKNKINLKNKIFFSDEKDFIRGSAGGLKFAEAFLEKNIPILCANADEVIIAENMQFIHKLLDQHYANKNLATLVVMKHELAGTKFGAIWCDKKMKVHHIGKISDSWKNEHNLEPYHFVGIQVLDRQILDSVDANKEQNIFYDGLIYQLKHQKVEAFEIQADWYETGNLQDYLVAKKQILQKKDQSSYQNFLEELKKLPLSRIDDLS